MGFVVTLLWILFILSAFLLSGLILLQESKGGGLAEAFGGAGAEAFGVKAGGVTKLTAVLGAIFLGSAILVGSCGDQTLYDAPMLEDPGPGIPDAVTVPAGE